jgi:hypothetical protein
MGGHRNPQADQRLCPSTRRHLPPSPSLAPPIWLSASRHHDQPLPPWQASVWTHPASIAWRKCELGPMAWHELHPKAWCSTTSPPLAWRDAWAWASSTRGHGATQRELVPTAIAWRTGELSPMIACTSEEKAKVARGWRWGHFGKNLMLKDDVDGKLTNRERASG